MAAFAGLYGHIACALSYNLLYLYLCVVRELAALCVLLALFALFAVFVLAAPAVPTVPRVVPDADLLYEARFVVSVVPVFTERSAPLFMLAELRLAAPDISLLLFILLLILLL